MTVIDEHVFNSEGIPCRGRLYQPDGGREPRPCVVMGHGFGATQDCGLQPYIEALVAAGYVVFTFDYRHFGNSDGEPRQLLVIEREIRDWQAAIQCARRLPAVDEGRVALWGTSLGGGLVTSAAARDGGVSAMVAQCPMMDGRASALAVLKYGGPLYMLRLAGHGTVDLMRGSLGLPPHYIPSAGKPGQIAAMSSADAWPGYMALLPDDVPNRVAARIVTRLMFYRPISEAPQVKCPALIQICDRDSVAPPDAAAKAASLMRQAQVTHYDCGHFDIYQGDFRQQSIRDQLGFLKEQMPV